VTLRTFANGFRRSSDTSAKTLETTNSQNPEDLSPQSGKIEVGELQQQHIYSLRVSNLASHLVRSVHDFRRFADNLVYYFADVSGIFFIILVRAQNSNLIHGPKYKHRRKAAI
jgi:hypothetical protein